VKFVVKISNLQSPITLSLFAPSRLKQLFPLPLLTAHCSLLTAHCSLLTEHSTPLPLPTRHFFRSRLPAQAGCAESLRIQLSSPRLTKACASPCSTLLPSRLASPCSALLACSTLLPLPLKTEHTNPKDLRRTLHFNS
jgi:hypothetical protein